MLFVCKILIEEMWREVWSI